jgi:HAD superfamily hydrolase (TIGR01484 family)
MSIAELATWPYQGRKQIQGVLTDIDDTLTTHGKLTADVLAAIAAAKAGGLRVIAATGRPTYWTLPLLGLCGFDAVIAENGASAFWFDDAGHLQSMFYVDEAERLAHRQQLLALSGLLEAEFPGLRLTQDLPMRIGDLAWDIGENIPPMPLERIEKILAFMRARGFHTTVSSIHAHASVLPFTKQSMSQRVLLDVFGISDQEAQQRWVFIGDSVNDASMFSHYANSVGVANVAPFLARLPRPPAYITTRKNGAGFVELIQALLETQGKKDA